MNTTVEQLNPKGVVLRKSRDRDDQHPSTAVAVVLDGTVGSDDRDTLPRITRDFERWVPGPQVLYAQVGGPKVLQVGEFDNHLPQFATADPGPMELAAYFLARHTSTDCYEKRGERGWAFLVTDQAPRAEVPQDDARSVIGDTLRRPIPTGAILEELAERWHVAVILLDAAHKAAWEQTGQGVLVAKPGQVADAATLIVSQA